MAKPYLLQQLENNKNDKDIFYAIYDETTYEEILDAYQAGKVIMAKYPYFEDDDYMGDDFYTLIYWNDEYKEFGFSLVSYVSPIYQVFCSKKNGETFWEDYFEYDGRDMNVYGNINMAYAVSDQIPDTNRVLRPILISNTEPTNAEIGDIWIKYST